MKDIVFYYSHSGNNGYAAKITAQDIGADIEAVKPVSAGLFPLIFSTLTGLPCALKKNDADPAQYDRVILFTPIWMGNIPSPARAFIHKHKKSLKNVHFVTCCGGGEREKDDKFGWNSVFAKAAHLIPDANLQCTALSIETITPPELKGNTEELMKLRLNDQTRTPSFDSVYQAFINSLR